MFRDRSEDEPVDSPRFVYETAGVCKECAVDRIQYSQFAESLDGEEQHETNDDEAKELIRISTLCLLWNG